MNKLLVDLCPPLWGRSQFVLTLTGYTGISRFDARERSATQGVLTKPNQCCGISTSTHLAALVRRVLRLGIIAYRPLIVVMTVLPSLTWAEANEDLKPDVCVATPVSPFYFFKNDAAEVPREAHTDGLNSDVEANGNFDAEDDISQTVGKAGLPSLLSGLSGMGKMEAPTGGAADMVSSVMDVSGEGNELARLKDAMQSLSGLMEGTAAGGNGLDISDMKSLFAAAAEPLFNGDHSEFLDKLQDLISKRNPDLKNLLDDLVSNPYMDVEEISMPTVKPDVYALKGSENEHRLPDSLEDTVSDPILRPKTIVLSKIKSFAEAPEDILVTRDESSVCHVLVLSGTGVKGAFQAGAIVGLAEQYKTREQSLRWDVVSGVSFGGIAAAFSLPFEPGSNDELDYGHSLWNFWRGLHSEDVLKCKEGMRDLVNIPATLKWMNEAYKMWKDKNTLSTLGTAHSCDPSPYQQTLRRQLFRHLKSHDRQDGCRTNKRTVTLSAAIVGGGEKQFRFTHADLIGNCEARQESVSGPSRQDFVLTAMLATSALPGIFPLVQFGSEETIREGEEGTRKGQVFGREKELHGDSEEKVGNSGDGNAPDQTKKSTSEGDAEGRRNLREQTTENYLLADGSFTSFLNITPAIKACQEKLIEAQRVEEGDRGGAMEEESERNAYTPRIQDRASLNKDVAEGKGIVFDFIVSSEVDTSTVDESLEEVFDSEDDIFDNGASPLANINTLAESFPQAHIRHVISFEDRAEVAHDVMDLRSVGPLLEHGRVAGWKAATLKSVRALKD